jgi:4-phosphopantoate--beta-alanine ligase
MTIIPKSHPRLNSLLIREKLVKGFDNNLVAKEGLLAHGRGEAFDYLIGEKTSKSAKEAIKAAAFMLKNAENSVISVNGNFAALCPKEIIQLAKNTNSKIEVNYFILVKNVKKQLLKF